MTRQRRIMLRPLPRTMESWIEKIVDAGDTGIDLYLCRSNTYMAPEGRCIINPHSSGDSNTI